MKIFAQDGPLQLLRYLFVLPFVSRFCSLSVLAFLFSLFSCRLNPMDYLRSLWDLDQSRVGFYEYGEPAALLPPPPKKHEVAEELKVEILKTTSLRDEYQRSGKQRVRHRAFVLATDGKGKVGIGIKVNRVQKIAIEKATDQAKSEMFEIALGNFDPEKEEKHTLSQQVHGQYDKLEVILIPAATGAGLEGSAIVQFILRLIGVKDCIVKPESSKFSAFHLLL